MGFKLVPLVVVLVCSLFLGVRSANGGSSPLAPTKELSGIIRDQSSQYMLTCTPNGSPGDANNGQGFYPTDFELPLNYYTNNEKGLVGAQCDPGNNWQNCGKIGPPTDNTPQYAYTGTSPGKNIQSPATFYNWFHSTDQVRFMNLSITLTLDPTDNTYGYQNFSFFPLDGLGWRDHCNGHNYNYCYEVHTLFGFTGTETFNFLGDDDVWVYIEGMLVIDLGSLHQALSASLDVGTVPGITVGGGPYTLDFFYCERHTTESDIQLTTSLAPFCSYYDWCGLCQGNGQGCCTTQLIQEFCNDNNPCTQDLCGISVAPGNGPEGCQHIPLNCTAPDDCTTATCGPNGTCIFGKVECGGDNCTTTTCQAKGGCLSANISCDDHDACTNDFCDPNRQGGCYHTTVNCPGDACNTASCNPKVGCTNTTVKCNAGNKCKSGACDPIDGCSNANISCGPPDACVVYTCDPQGGCGHYNVSCDDGKGCTIDTCVSGTGPGSGCTHTLKDCSDITGGNQCLVPSCDNTTTQGCLSLPKTCPPQPCKTATCDPDNGCQYADVVCTGGNKCTDAFCDVSTGQCSYPPKVCTSTDACQNATCDLATGDCVLSNITCTDGDPCTQDLCFSDAGCSYPPQNCAGDDGQCPNSPTCDDGNACTADICNTNFTCGYIPIVCNQTNPCQNVTCDPKVGCRPINKSCDDGNPCTTEQCDITNGQCVYVTIPLCVPCGDLACIGTDSCNPSNCVDNACQVQPYTGCPATDHCTDYVCNGSDVSPVCQPVSISCTTEDACHPVSCVVGTGCVPGNKSCDDGNPCTNDYCSDGACHNDAVVCPYTDFCNPVSCNADTGACDVITPVNCGDGNLCSQDVCDNTTGHCSNPPVDCGDDACNPKTCNNSDGLCYPVPPFNPCASSTPCANVTLECVDGALVCNTTVNTCDDGDPCTIDSCNSKALPGQDPCSHVAKICTTDKCNVNLGCSNITGLCESVPLDCNTTDFCFPGSCQPNFGCINTTRYCPVKDVGCYFSTCVYDNDTLANGTCVQSRVDDWSHSTGKGGVLCPLLYDPGAKAGIITGGVVAGIVVGGVAAAALLGFGGKKTYDLLMAKNSPVGGVSNNPLYAPSAGSGENVLFRG